MNGKDTGSILVMREVIDSVLGNLVDPLRTEKA